ncbi:MAG: hypothetical protein WCB94_19535 [Terriglobales bacterium]
MLATNMKLAPAVVNTLQIWHGMIEMRDLGRLESIVHPEAVFRSPMAFQAYAAAPALILVVKTAITVLEDFTYHRQFAGDDYQSVVLEFSARVGAKNLKGIDMIRFDAEGKIVEFEVMVRPLNALQALGAEMGARLGQYLPSFKGKV